MTRRGQFNRGKERFWRQVLRRWRRSGLSIRDFCAAESLAEPSFYSWRRTLADRDQQAAADTADPGNAARRDGQPLFVPLRVVPAAAALELVLGRDRVVRVPAGFDAATLRQLLAVLEEAPPC